MSIGDLFSHFDVMNFVHYIPHSFFKLISNSINIFFCHFFIGPDNIWLHHSRLFMVLVSSGYYLLSDLIDCLKWSSIPRLPIYVLLLHVRINRRPIRNINLLSGHRVSLLSCGYLLSYHYFGYLRNASPFRV